MQFDYVQSNTFLPLFILFICILMLYYKALQGDSKKNHGRMDSIRQAPRHLQG